MYEVGYDPKYPEHISRESVKLHTAVPTQHFIDMKLFSHSYLCRVLSQVITCTWAFKSFGQINKQQHWNCCFHYNLDRSWLSWRQPYLMTNLTGIPSKPMMSHRSRCPDPPLSSPEDTQMHLARSCSVSPAKLFTSIYNAHMSHRCLCVNVHVNVVMQSVNCLLLSVFFLSAFLYASFLPEICAYVCL